MHPSHVFRNGSKSNRMDGDSGGGVIGCCGGSDSVACPDSQMGSGFCLLFADSNGENTQPWHGKLVVIVYKAAASKTLNDHWIVVSR
jgi:hypothetical protein